MPAGPGLRPAAVGPDPTTRRARLSRRARGVAPYLTQRISRRFRRDFSPASNGLRAGYLSFAQRKTVGLAERCRSDDALCGSALLGI